MLSAEMKASLEALASQDSSVGNSGKGVTALLVDVGSFAEISQSESGSFPLKVLGRPEFRS